MTPEEMSEYNREKYKRNREYYREYYKKYYEVNRERVLAKVTCGCGSVASEAGMPAHRRSIKHLTWVLDVD